MYPYSVRIRNSNIKNILHIHTLIILQYDDYVSNIKMSNNTKIITSTTMQMYIQQTLALSLIFSACLASA
jgi:hypothetical protein